MKKIIALVSLLSFIHIAATTPVFYVSPQQISAGFTASLAGTYVLTDNATLSSTLSLNADNVIFDFNGKTITADANPKKLLHVGSFNNIAVKNGTLDGALLESGKGIYVDVSSSNVSISNMTITRVQDDDGNGTGIYVDAGSTAVRIDGCSIIYSGTGLVFDGGSKGWVTNCDASFNAGEGFSFINSCTAFINNCIANNNDGIGFYVDSTSEVVLKNSSAELNADYGFSVASTTSQLRGNIAFGNGGRVSCSTSDNNYYMAIAAFPVPGCTNCVAFTQIFNGYQEGVGAILEAWFDNISIIPGSSVCDLLGMTGG